MSVALFASHQEFDPETVEVLASAFDKICAELGLSACADRMTELVARHVIAAAQMGIRNEADIRLTVLQEFKSPAVGS
jgi:hypothetical protein